MSEFVLKFYLNILSTLKNDIAKKSYDEFTVLHIISTNSREQVQNFAKLVTPYSEKVL